MDTTLAKVQMAKNKVFPSHFPQNKKLALQAEAWMNLILAFMTQSLEP